MQFGGGAIVPSEKPSGPEAANVFITPMNSDGMSFEC
jgi:hypothetical protein